MSHSKPRQIRVGGSTTMWPACTPLPASRTAESALIPMQDAIQCLMSDGLPHHAENHDSVPAAGSDVRERAPRSVERPEIGRIGRVVRGVRRIEAVILVRVVHVEAKAEPQ